MVYIPLAGKYKLCVQEWIAMSPYSENTQPEKEERIRVVAHLIWEREGRPDGHALAHWVKATEIVEAEDNARPGATSENS